MASRSRSYQPSRAVVGEPHPHHTGTVLARFEAAPLLRLLPGRVEMEAAFPARKPR